MRAIITTLLVGFLLTPMSVNALEYIKVDNSLCIDQPAMDECSHRCYKCAGSCRYNSGHRQKHSCVKCEEIW